MKKLARIFLSILALLSAFTVNAKIVDNKNALPSNKEQHDLSSTPFDEDPFFQSQNDIIRQMRTMQKAMDQLMETQFSKINSLAHHYDQHPFGSDTNIEIKESHNELIYKIKLPKGTNNKVDVSIKNDHLVLSLDATQKITHDHDHAKTVTYSQNNYSQSFKVPSGYDLKSMDTQIKDSNLIVTFKKLDQGNKLSTLRNAL